MYNTTRISFSFFNSSSRDEFYPRDTRRSFKTVEFVRVYQVKRDWKTRYYFSDFQLTNGARQWGELSRRDLRDFSVSSRIDHWRRSPHTRTHNNKIFPTHFSYITPVVIVYGTLTSCKLLHTYTAAKGEKTKLKNKKKRLTTVTKLSNFRVYNKT